MFRLEDWILAQQAKGYNDNQIEEYLISRGYHKELVDKTLLDLKYGTETVGFGTEIHIVDKVTNSNPNKKMFLWLGVSLFILVVLIAGMYYVLSVKDNPIIKNYLAKLTSGGKADTSSNNVVIVTDINSLNASSDMQINNTKNISNATDVNETVPDDVLR